MRIRRRRGGGGGGEGGVGSLRLHIRAVRELIKAEIDEVLAVSAAATVLLLCQLEKRQKNVFS